VLYTVQSVGLEITFLRTLSNPVQWGHSLFFRSGLLVLYATKRPLRLREIPLTNQRAVLFIAQLRVYSNSQRVHGVGRMYQTKKSADYREKSPFYKINRYSAQPRAESQLRWSRKTLIGIRSVVRLSRSATDESHDNTRRVSGRALVS